MSQPSHDGASRALFEHPLILESLVLGFARSVVGDRLDMSTLKRVAARHVSDGLQQSENDMIWEVQARQGGQLYVYLMLEFQAQPDWTMPLRMANYVGQFYRGLLARAEVRAARQLPQVLPLVVYSGKAAWPACADVHDLIDRTLPGLVPYGLRMPYLLVDVWRNRGLDRALRNVADAVFRLQRAESLEAGRGELELLAEWLRGEEWADLRRVLVRWIMKVLVPAGWQPALDAEEVADLQELVEVLEGEMRTWEDNFREAAEAEGLAKGRSEGLAKGRSEGLLNLVRHKFGEAFAAEVAPALGMCQSVQALDEMGVFLLTCDSSEALLAKVRAL
ncbi:MAG: Rpn family recombination-promoting nuclease/putative transposase [Acidobacteriia bacterium]|nr:Rpn family recombination-promoting nuclease/putative transposase [Terriglobia bacterium]